MKIVIVDDESLARERLASIISELSAGDVIAQGNSGHDAINLCDKHKPDVLLLDIRMPVMDGIEAAEHVMKMETPPAIIFTTAYDEYAIAAFDKHAVDYLLKPINKDRLDEALVSAEKLTQAQVAHLKEQASASNKKNRSHISARLGSELRLIPIQDICYFMAEHKYVTVHYNGGEVLLEETLKSLEVEFSEQFVRIHRNALISIGSLLALEKNKSGQHFVKLRDCEQVLEVSRRHLSQIKSLMKSL